MAALTFLAPANSVVHEIPFKPSPPWPSCLSPCVRQRTGRSFAGPTARGTPTKKGIPIHWAEDENITWKTAVPGQGWSSPVIAGKQVWMTSAGAEGKSLHAVCIDKNRWQIAAQCRGFDAGGGWPAPSVEWLRLPDAGAGRRARVRPLRPARHRVPGHGRRHPLEKHRVRLQRDSGGSQLADPPSRPVDSHLRRHRQPIHRSARQADGEGQVEAAAGAPRGRRQEAVHRKNGLLHAACSAHRRFPQLVCSGADHVAAYDLTTGSELWWMPYNGFSIVGRPSYGNGLFYVVGSIRQDHFCVYAVRPGKGRLRDDQVVWQRSISIPHVSSPILVGRELFVVHDGGVASCVDALTGREHWRERLGGNHDASPVEIRGRIYFCNREGKTTIVAASDKFEVLAINQLKGNFKASPAIADGALFLRSDTHLYRIEKSGDQSL